MPFDRLEVVRRNFYELEEQQYGYQPPLAECGNGVAGGTYRP
jgi:hypothetical protein